MADRAGLRLAERYAGWDRRPFTSASTGHVSVYQQGVSFDDPGTAKTALTD
jgi:hypothetical protein